MINTREREIGREKITEGQSKRLVLLPPGFQQRFRHLHHSLSSLSFRDLSRQKHKSYVTAISNIALYKLIRFSFFLTDKDLGHLSVFSSCYVQLCSLLKGIILTVQHVPLHFTNKMIIIIKRCSMISTVHCMTLHICRHLVVQLKIFYSLISFTRPRNSLCISLQDAERCRERDPRQRKWVFTIHWLNYLPSISSIWIMFKMLHVTLTVCSSYVEMTLSMCCASEQNDHLCTVCHGARSSMRQ